MYACQIKTCAGDDPFCPLFKHARLSCLHCRGHVRRGFSVNVEAPSGFHRVLVRHTFTHRPNQDHREMAHSAINNNNGVKSKVER